MTDFNKLIAADELMQDYKIPIESNPNVPAGKIYMMNKEKVTAEINNLENMKQPQRWGFIKFVEESASYMAGTGALRFYLALPYVWYKFDRWQRKDAKDRKV